MHDEFSNFLRLRGEVALTFASLHIAQPLSSQIRVFLLSKIFSFYLEHSKTKKFPNTSISFEKGGQSRVQVPTLQDEFQRTLRVTSRR
jgi:hypothetical protein